MDKDNHGPSYIIALGNYEGGRLWCWHQDGDIPMRLPCGQNHFKGFPTSLLDRDMCVPMFDGDKVVDTKYNKGGDVYWAKSHNIRETWLRFSGLVPHTVEEHSGIRISIGYFTRKNWLDWSPDVKSQLEMSKNLMVVAPFPFVVFPFPCLLPVVAE